MKTVAVVMRKGGNGKSTSTLNLAHAFALSGKQVLLIDLDDQKNTTSAIATREVAGKTIEHLLIDENTTVADVAVETNWNGVSIIGASGNLSGLIRELEKEVGSHLVLKEKLINAPYDLCLIDTSPSLNILVVNALCAAQYVFIPVSSKYFSLSGLTQTLEAYHKVHSRLNPDLSIAGIAFVLHDRRSVLSREVVAEARKAYESLVFETVVGQNIRIEEAQVRKESIFMYAPHDRGAHQYRALADELEQRMAL